MKYFVIAGEASGDYHASRLMLQIKEKDGEADFRFIGGDAMREVSPFQLMHYRELAYMGFVQVMLHLSTILQGMKLCKKKIADYQPDALILVDYPGFNLNIAKWVRKHLPKTKIFYYISPQIWAWKEHRLKAIRRDVDAVLSILPFEVDWYRKRGYDKVYYVGNPSMEEVLPLLAKPKQEVPRDQQYILLVPGSRKAEVRDNLRVMLGATRDMNMPRVIAGAPGLDAEFYAEVLDQMGKGHDSVEVVFGKTHSLMRNAQVAAVTSGTAALEASLLDCPQVVCYNFKGGMLVYSIMHWVLRKISFVTLPNLIYYGLGGGAKINERQAFVCELLGPYLSAKTLRHEMEELLTDRNGKRRQQLEGNAEVRARLELEHKNAPQVAAQHIVQLLKE